MLKWESQKFSHRLTLRFISFSVHAVNILRNGWERRSWLLVLDHSGCARSGAAADRSRRCCEGETGRAAMKRLQEWFPTAVWDYFILRDSWKTVQTWTKTECKTIPFFMKFGYFYLFISYWARCVNFKDSWIIGIRKASVSKKETIFYWH